MISIYFWEGREGGRGERDGDGKRMKSTMLGGIIEYLN